ncbi:hypothetical protein MWN34_07675 [Ancylobacter sp. 6x-1]|uniref:Uncharacterized protein n=1 Tax=Ancylobacter crimeensis TaxID=2579147 RepID=A0ABT0DA15_9HYPH|nr:hypothetical protein [Ancylobacter crimeensis]MCK0196792.1 hypothetical protein [Ancylobacter crimeensis]
MSDIPDRMAVLVDMNKQIVGVSGAMIALAATFLTGLIGQNSSPWVLSAIGIAALLLLLATCCALISHAKAPQYYAALAAPPPNADAIKQAWSGCAGWANTAFILFAAALAAIFVFGALRVLDPGANDARTAIDKSAELLLKDGKIADRKDWTSIATAGSGDSEHWVVTFNGVKGTTVACKVSTRSGALQACQ